MIKASWVYLIIKSLEARLEYCEDEEFQEELDILNEALAYFRSLQVGGEK